MKQRILTIFLLCFTVAAFGQQTGIAFRNLTLEQAQAQAKAEHKLVFLHGFATWCHFCEYMKDSVYVQKEVGEFVNQHFVPIRMDMEKEGKELNRRLMASSYPQLVFFDGNGEIVHRVAGQKSAFTFLQLCNDALDPAKQYRTYEQKFKNGTATQAEVGAFFKMMNSAAIDAQPTFSKYFMGLPDSIFLTGSSFRLFNDYMRDVEQPAMKRFLINRAVFSHLTSADSVDNRIINNYNSSLMMIAQRLDSAHFYSLENQLKASGLDLSDKIIAYASLNLHKMKSEYDAYQKEAVPFIEKYCRGDHRRLSEVAYNIYDKGTDPEILKKAELWAKEAVSISENYRNYQALSCILYKNGKKEDALTAVNKALEWAKKLNVDPKQSQLMLDKINAMP